METIKGVGAKVTDFISGMFGTSAPAVASQAEKAVAPLPNGQDLGMSAEPGGYTSSGGRRISKMKKGKKTLKGGRRGRKTQRK